MKIIEKTKMGEQTHEKAKVAMELYHSGDPEKRKEGLEIMISLFETIIWKNIHRNYYWMTDEDKDDLFQEGCLAIMESISEYDPATAAPTTYFTYRIIGRMNVYVKEKSGIKKHRATTHNKIVKAEEALIDMGIEPTVENITRLIDDPRISREVVYINKNVMSSAKSAVSLDQEMEGDFNFIDGFVQEKNTPEKLYEKQEMLDVFQKAISSLPEIQQAVIRDIFIEEMSIKNTAHDLGISEADVKRHKTLAFHDIKNAECVRRYCGKENHTDEILIHLENEDVDIDGAMEGIIFIE